MKDIDVTRLREDMLARLQAIAEMKNTTFDEFQAWLDIERERRTAVLKRFSAHVTKTTNGELDGGDVMCLANCGKCVLKEGWASYNRQDYNTGSLPTTARSVVDLLAFAEDCIRHCTETVEKYGLSEVGVGSVNDELPAKIASLLSNCEDVMDALQHSRGRLLAGELTVTCTEGDVMGCGEGETKKGREEADRPIGVVLRLNDEVSADDKSRHVLKLWHVLDAKGELRLNDFEYDSVDCGESWVIGGLDTAASSVCPQTDVMRDPRWGWVPHDAPLLCGRVKVPMCDAMGNVWTTCYINGSFSSRHLSREVTEEEKMAMACPTPAARCFSPPLRNPVELEVAEGKVFAGDHGYTYTHARGEDATADGITTLVWDSFNLNPDVLAAIDIAAHVIPEGQLQQHVAPQKYGYRVNWVPGCLQPATVDRKVTMAAKLQTGHWLPLGWMHAGMVEQWQFLVVVARVSIFNADVKDHVLVVEHAKRCWEKIREEDRQMGDGENRYMAHIRRRHGCSALVGWVPAVCRMTYEQGGEMMMRFRDPLGVPFLLTYSDGLLRDIRYMVAEDTRGGHRRPGQTEETRPRHHDGLSAEVEGPGGGERVVGCSTAQGDVVGPSKTAMSHSPRKVKAVVSRPRRGKTAGDKQKKNPQPVPQTGNNADAPARVHRRRRHPGMATLTEIRKLQRSTDLCIPFRPFLRVVREVVEKDITPNKGLRFEMTVVRALMEAAEAYLVANFENTNEVAIHSKRVTIQEMDSGPRVCDCGRPFMPLWTLNSHCARACPAVADEGAQRQENDAAHDPGPSNIGAANLAGDESEDAGAEDDANGAAGDNAEPAAQPVEPFDSSRRLAALIFSTRGGVGMSHMDVDALLSLLKDPRFNATDIAYRNSRECFAWAGSLAEAAGWKELDLRSDD
ncbi:hypothetical protein CBR_g29872 [Chara braunii]|uniref:Core Histone H2A/H2B/H3 domain-containing protein n=1 Tax=Chara braunii TaxID=69332 RepID=A0A388JWS2_CHABU|nr:hypothetical protein CBR_g29872 [Chara braunii]|eukprot:GBG62264.1 hypothetical protein CBR_g29872 [Chara braunii]